MASDASKNKKKGGGGRTTALAGLLAVGAVIGAWLSNCIPGFGIGADGAADGDAQQAEQAEEPAEPAQPEAKQAEPTKQEGEASAGAEAGGAEASGAEQAEPDAPIVGAPAGPLQITIDTRGCIVTTEGVEGAGAPQDCTKLCGQDELLEAHGKQVEIDSTDGPHKSVVSFIDCLKTKGVVEVSIKRDQ